MLAMAGLLVCVMEMAELLLSATTTFDKEEAEVMMAMVAWSRLRGEEEGEGGVGEFADPSLG